MKNSKEISSPEFKEFTGLKKGWFCLDRGLWNVVKEMYPDKNKAERMPYHYVLIMMYNDAWYGDEPYLINHKVNNKSGAYYLNKGEFEFKRDYWSEVTGLTSRQIRTFEQKLTDLGMICVVKNGKGQLPIYRLSSHYSDNTQVNTQVNTSCSNDAGLRGAEVNTQVNTQVNTPTNISVNKEVNKDYSNKNSTVIDAASLRSAAIRPTASGNAFSEKDKCQITSEPNSLYPSYQPQPVQAPEFHMNQQSLPNNEDNAFGIVELFDRLKLYLPEGFILDKNQQAFIRTEYFKIANPNRRQGSFCKQNGELWDLYSFAEWMAKLLREQGVQTSDKPSVPSVVQQNQSSVPAPFTKDTLLQVILNEPEIVKQELLSKYDAFQARGWKTSNGNPVDLTFFTGFLRDEVRKALNITQGSLQYNEYDINKLDYKNFFKKQSQLLNK